MTETEWLQTEELGRLAVPFPGGLDGLRQRQRKMILFVCGNARHVERLIDLPEISNLISIGEEIAERAGTEDIPMPVLLPICHREEELAAAKDRSWRAASGKGDAWQVLERRHSLCQQVRIGITFAAGTSLPSWPPPSSEFAGRRTRADLFRDIIGNPFRPVTADPSWLTSTVVSLAEGIYADRAFDRLPILADALQDAGCDNPDVLEHCHGPGPHVRGCWVVDLILGKA
jgi:hypothetical protein